MPYSSEEKPPMSDIMMVFACLNQSLPPTALRQLTVVAQALLALTGRVTMLGLSRWAGQGGSYRTIQRFFNTTVTWSVLQWLLIHTPLWESGETLVAAGDDVIVTKSGKCTHGLDRFFCSIYSKVVPGLGFLSLSLISVKRRVSYPVMLEQLEQPKTAQAQGETELQPQGKGKPGRRKGSKNLNRRDVNLSPYLQFVQRHLQHLLELIGPYLKLDYFVFDGALGNNDAVQMVRQIGLHLISKWRPDSALYVPYEGPYSGRGPRKKYGDKINYQDIPERYLKTSSIDKNEPIETKIYQIQVWHKKFSDLLNVVVIVKTHLKTHKVAHVVLFSSDLELSYDLVIDYYRLRFQIEFNFRDAKQHWGLEDFMVVKERPVYNSANLALFMVNVSQALMRPMRAQWPELSVNDLKTWFRSRKYVVETLKLLPEMPEADFIDQAIAQIAQLGWINQAVNPT
jgi:putative transposase